MNLSQKLAALALRFIGIAVAFVGIAGALYAIAAFLLVGTKMEMTSENWSASVVWTIVGVLLVIFSKPLGRLLGRGLD